MPEIFIFWRCPECNVVEMTHGITCEIYHKHGENGKKIRLICKTGEHHES